MTLYDLIQQSGITAPKKDLDSIGIIVIRQARKDNIQFKKIRQRQGKYKYWVANYPDSFIPVMQDIILQYFTSKLKAA